MAFGQISEWFCQRNNRRGATVVSECQKLIDFRVDPFCGWLYAEIVDNQHWRIQERRIPVGFELLDPL